MGGNGGEGKVRGRMDEKVVYRYIYLLYLSIILISSLSI